MIGLYFRIKNILKIFKKCAKYILFDNNVNGTYDATISGTLTRFGSDAAYNYSEKLRRVISFSEVGLTSLKGAFRGRTKAVQ